MRNSCESFGPWKKTRRGTQDHERKWKVAHAGSGEKVSMDLRRLHKGWQSTQFNPSTQTYTSTRLNNVEMKTQ